jgi:predicted nucleic-acid-binding Zn-ribbon protein
MIHACRNCGGTELYSQEVNANGGDGLKLLPLGWLTFSTYEIVICAQCGLTEWFVPERLLRKVQGKFKRVNPPRV